MDPMTMILGIVVALQGAYQVHTKYKTDRQNAKNERERDEAKRKADEAKIKADATSQIDARFKAILERQDTEIRDLRARVEKLERMEEEYVQAKIYMALHNLPWPPPKGSETSV